MLERSVVCVQESRRGPVAQQQDQDLENFDPRGLMVRVTTLSPKLGVQDDVGAT